MLTPTTGSARNSRIARRTGMVAIAALVVACTLLPAGCQRALFVDRMPRTQFETYEHMRQRYVPMEEPDVFGHPQPALRARLSQR